MNKSTVKLIGSEEILAARPLPVFHEWILSFLSDVGTALMKNADAKKYPDIITFAFFLRKSNLLALQKNYPVSEKRVGRGLSFHVAPSNVPVNFAYSLVTGLLAGTPCIVKASSKNFPQTRIICNAFSDVLSDFPQLKDFLCVVMYPREDTEQTQEFCSQCAVRVIWGGDETVSRIRSLPVSPRTIDITFADRYSAVVINSKALLALNRDELEKLANGFYNDTYLTDQNACTSPRLLNWIGNEEDTQKAQEIFWNSVHTFASKKYQLDPLTAVDKLTAAASAMIEQHAVMNIMPDNTVVRLQIPKLNSNIVSCRAPGGFFPEYRSACLQDLFQIVTPRYQTLSQFGFDEEELRNLVVSNRLTGIDRICAIGHTMDFSLIWDGCDLIRSFSRVIG